MMKQIYCTAFAASLLLAACHREAPRTRSVDMPQTITMRVTAADTTEVLTQVTEFMNYLSVKDYDNALDMLCMLNPRYPKGQPMGLTDERRAELEKRLRRFPLRTYAVESLSFRKAYDNDVRCRVTLDNGTEMVFSIAPLRYVGYWYLSLRD